MASNASTADRRTPWNKGKIVGQKAPFRLKDIWAIRVRLQGGLVAFALGVPKLLPGGTVMVNGAPSDDMVYRAFARSACARPYYPRSAETKPRPGWQLQRLTHPSAPSVRAPAAPVPESRPPATHRSAPRRPPAHALPPVPSPESALLAAGSACPARRQRS